MSTINDPEPGTCAFPSARYSIDPGCTSPYAWASSRLGDPAVEDCDAADLLDDAATELIYGTTELAGRPVGRKKAATAAMVAAGVVSALAVGVVIFKYTGAEAPRSPAVDVAPAGSPAVQAPAVAPPPPAPQPAVAVPPPVQAVPAPSAPDRPVPAPSAPDRSVPADPAAIAPPQQLPVGAADAPPAPPAGIPPPVDSAAPPANPPAGGAPVVGGGLPSLPFPLPSLPFPLPGLTLPSPAAQKPSPAPQPSPPPLTRSGLDPCAGCFTEQPPTILPTPIRTIPLFPVLPGTAPRK